MDNSIVWIAAGSIATGFLALAVYIEIVKPWFNRPKFTVEFDNREPYCRKALVVPSGGKLGYWIRLKVINSGHYVAKSCIGKLAKVMDAEGKHLIEYDPMLLHWVTTPRGTIPTPIDLKQGEWEFLDFFHTDERNSGLAFIDTDGIERGIPKWFKPGIYRVVITIYGDNVVPKAKTYRLSLWGKGNIMDITDVELKEI